MASQKETYRVIHRRRVLGHPPGATFTARLDPVQRDQLIASGAIEVVNKHEVKENGESRADRRGPDGQLG